MREGEPPEDMRAHYAFQHYAWKLFAPFYDPIVFPFRRLREDVASAVRLSAGARLLDVATGTGAQAFAFARDAREVVGIDMSDAMLRIARRKNRFANVTFLRADATRLPFADDSFDASCMSFALHEMPRSICEAVVREMARVTRRGGLVVAVDYGLPRGRVASWLAYHFVRLYEGATYAWFVRSDWQRLLENAAIDVTDDRSLLRGMARVVTGMKRVSDARAAEGPRSRTDSIVERAYNVSASSFMPPQPPRSKGAPHAPR